MTKLGNSEALLQLWPSLRSLTSSFKGSCENANHSDNQLCHASLALNTNNSSQIEYYFALMLVLLLLSLGVTAGMLLQQRKQQQVKTDPQAGKTVQQSNGSTDSLPASNISIDKSKVPKHIAVIMDGNRRYGREKHCDPLQGHWAGGQVLVDFVQWCIEEGVEVTTVYAFSTENWNRESREVTTLMSIFAQYAETFKKEALSRNVKVNIFSTEFDKLPVKVQHSVQELERATSHCSGFIVNICLSYGGRDEIVQACRSLAKDVQDGKVQDVNGIDEALFASKLKSASYPDPDILIRTSGEYRLSNFLLWQLAYTEMFFIDKYWPELTQRDVKGILQQYCQNRQRRYGK